MRKSVERSLERLGVQVLDVVYCHDVEFVTKKEVLAAVRELYKLRDEGKIRYVGISGTIYEFFENMGGLFLTGRTSCAVTA